MHLIVSRRTMLPSAVDWSEFHVWSFLVSDVEKTHHKNALRLGVELNCSSCVANRLPPKDRKLRVRFKLWLDAPLWATMAYLHCRIRTLFRLYKLSVYIALCRSFLTAQSQIQIPILTANYRNGIGILVHTRVRLPQCK